MSAIQSFSLRQWSARQPLLFLGVAVVLWWLLYQSLMPASEVAVAALPVVRDGHLGGALQFFFYDTPKVLMLLTGIVDSPAPWEYEVKIQREDWATILKTAVSKDAVGFIARRASFGAMIAMAWPIIRFIVLLSWYRAIRVLTPRRDAAA